MTFKKHLTSLLLFILIAGTNTANNPNRLLWKISGNGLPAPSYLFGTHHLVSVSFLDEINGLHEAFESTCQMIGEMDLREMNNIQLKIMQNALMPNDTTYNQLMNAEDIQLLDNLLLSLTGMGFEQLSSLKPAMLSNLIAVSLYKKYYPNESGESIDQYLQKKAAELSHAIVGLETADEQMFVLLNSQTLPRQAEILACTINHPEILKQNIDKLEKAYTNQDMEQLLLLAEKKMEDDPCPSTPEEQDIINKKRNERWLKVLPKMIAEKPSFIAIGCLHLVGQHGIIEGLRKLGYKLEPVL